MLLVELQDKNFLNRDLAESLRVKKFDCKNHLKTTAGVFDLFYLTTFFLTDIDRSFVQTRQNRAAVVCLKNILQKQKFVVLSENVLFG